MKMQKGSFTIEAVILVPLMFCMMLSVFSIAIDFYEESMHREISEELENWDSVSVFYKFWMVKEQGEESTDE